MSSFATLSPTTAYLTLLQQISDRDADLSKAMDPANTSVTTPATSMVRFNSANKRWETYSGSAWAETIAAATDAYNISVTGLRGGNIYGAVTNNGSITGGTINATVLQVAGSAAWTAASLTNLNQLTNGPAYISATALSTYAPLASPSLTGVPIAPTAAVDTSTTQLASTQFVVNQSYLKTATASTTYLPLAGGTMTGALAVAGTVSASGAGGFTSSTYIVNARNPIWRFGNSDTTGMSYFQGTSGTSQGVDTLGLHFGTATAAGSLFQFNSNGTFAAAGSVTAANFSGPGSGLTGTAAALTAGSAAASDTRAAATGPNTGSAGARFDFKTNSTDGLSDGGTYHGVLTFQQYVDPSGGGTRQLGFTDNDNLWIRGSGGALTAYGSWKRIIDSSSIGTYALPLTGGTLTGALAVAGTVSASGAGGFTSSTYLVNSRNPIWRFGNADPYGISYFQGASGLRSGDTIGMHFGTATAAGSLFQFNGDGTFAAAGSVTATNFSGPGSGLTGVPWSGIANKAIESVTMTTTAGSPGNGTANSIVFVY